MTDGLQILKQKVKTAPTCAGVYRMLNAKGDVLYVGKAKNLKNRLQSYTRPEGLSNRIRKMVFETRELILVETPTEMEALLLEISLIKSLKPRYNILFRDDSSYPYIHLSDHTSPRLMFHRGAKNKKGHYFGPYPGAGSVYKTIDFMEQAFRLRTCTDSMFNGRKRPCLKYHIKRCSGPCVGLITDENYGELVKQATLFLAGKEHKAKEAIQRKMHEAAAREDYETAAVERDRLQALAAIQGGPSRITHGLENADVLAAVELGGLHAVQAFYYRSGRHVGNKLWQPQTRQQDTTPVETLQEFILQHYANHPPPGEIYVNHLPEDTPLIEELLSAQAAKKITLNFPQRGEKLKLVQQAEANAKNTLQRQAAENASWNQQLAVFAEVLNSIPIKRIETFDISNISGKNAVASLVVADESGMNKNLYRKFTIKEQDTPDDYAMMHEVLLRRYKKLLKDSTPETFPDIFPSVVMVDGGKGHLSTLVAVFEEIGLLTHPQRPVLCAIAKGEKRDKGLETIFMHGSKQPLPIAYNSPLIFLLQRIRDESHRFAIGFHRQKRSKGLTHSGLDDVPGVGGKRKKALLLHFGSLESVKNASVEALQQVEGINSHMAQTIYDFFRP